jgi:hypothetical protein
MRKKVDKDAHACKVYRSAFITVIYTYFSLLMVYLTLVHLAAPQISLYRIHIDSSAREY